MEKKIKMCSRMQKKEEGIISIEASLALTTFVFCVLSLLSYMHLFVAKNVVSHAMVQTCQSLAMDSYKSQLMVDKLNDYVLLWKELEGYTDSEAKAPESAFVPEGFEWYASEASLKEAVRQVSMAYLGGIEGNSKTVADELLKSLRIKDGMDGLEITNISIADGDLSFTVKYTVELWFTPVFGLDGIENEQTVTGRLWGGDMDDVGGD